MVVEYDKFFAGGKLLVTHLVAIVMFVVALVSAGFRRARTAIVGINGVSSSSYCIPQRNAHTHRDFSPAQVQLRAHFIGRGLVYRLYSRECVF